jgi:hypothetical protein
LEVLQRGGEIDVFLMLPHGLAANMPVRVQVREPDGTWKSSVLRWDTGTGNTGHWTYFRLSPSPLSLSHANAGLPGQKPQSFSGQLDELNISSGLY